MHNYSPIPNVSAVAPYPSRSEIEKPVMALVEAKQALRQGHARRQVRRPGALLWTTTLLFGCLFLTAAAALPQLSRIETEKLVMALVETELQARRAKGAYAGKFAALAHYFGYEGRCALPTNFDATCVARSISCDKRSSSWMSMASPCMGQQRLCFCTVKGSDLRVVYCIPGTPPSQPQPRVREWRRMHVDGQVCA